MCACVYTSPHRNTSSADPLYPLFCFFSILVGHNSVLLPATPGKFVVTLSIKAYIRNLN